MKLIFFINIFIFYYMPISYKYYDFAVDKLGCDNIHL